MALLFFDTETTGLPKNWNGKMTDLDNWPRVIQLAWIITDNHGIEVNRGKYLIKPDGWTVPTDKFWIDNGFNTAHSYKEGVAMEDVLDLFITDLNLCGHLVSHNMSFDYNVLGSEMIRYRKAAAVKTKKLCTKELGTDVCMLPGNYGNYKWPKLVELHQFLFGCGFDGAHDALADVIACKDCFFEMLNKKIFTLN